jgi:hypothetical protein
MAKKIVVSDFKGKIGLGRVSGRAVWVCYDALRHVLL